MRTLVVLHSGRAYGPPQHVFPWMSLLAERGSVETVVPELGSAADLYRAIGTPTKLQFECLTYPHGLHDVFRVPTRWAAEVRTFRHHIRQTRPNLVFVASAFVPSALVAARLEGVSTIVYVGELFDTGLAIGPGRALGGAALSRLTGALADAVVCCSETVARQFLPSRRSVTTIYPGVDESYADGDGERFREAHGLTGADPCLAVVGNVTRGRGQDVAIRGLALLREEFPAVRLVIAGLPLRNVDDVAYNQELPALARRLRVDDAVAFVGFVDRMADLYAASDIVVNSARFAEPFGRVAVEALAAGRPFVAARVGAVPEVVRHGREALLFPADDHVALAEAIARLWCDPELRDELVRNGAQRVALRFSEQRAVHAFAGVIEQVLSSKPRKSPFQLEGKSQ